MSLVYIASRKLKAIEDAAKELNGLAREGGQCIAIQADLSSKDDTLKLAEKLKCLEQKLHILVNVNLILIEEFWNVLGNVITEFDEKNGWDRLFALNVKSVFYLTVAYGYE